MVGLCIGDPDHTWIMQRLTFDRSQIMNIFSTREVGHFLYHFLLKYGSAILIVFSRWAVSEKLIHAEVLQKKVNVFVRLVSWPLLLLFLLPY